MLVIRWPHGQGSRPRGSPDTALPNSGSRDHCLPVVVPLLGQVPVLSFRGELQGPLRPWPQHSAPQVSATREVGLPSAPQGSLGRLLAKWTGPCCLWGRHRPRVEGHRSCGGRAWGAVSR